MSNEYTEVLETEGAYRVMIILDQYPDEPYDCSQSPLIRMDYGSCGWRAEHIQLGDRPTDADDYVEEAAQRWGTDFDLLTHYLRAYHGATKVETWHSGSYWYITYDSAVWREWCGAAEGGASMAEYRAYCEGEVYGYVVQKNVTWTTADPDYEDEDRWEDTDDSCFGFYERDYAEKSAREALKNALPAPLDITPERLAAAVEDMERVSRNLADDRKRQEEDNHG